LKHLFFLKYARWQCILRFDNSTALYKDTITLHPGEIRTRELLLWMRTRWPMFHDGRAFKKTRVPKCSVSCDQKDYIVEIGN
jgi:hypothetical protein